MKREKRPTKKERKAADPGYRPGPTQTHQHIHCISCGRHLDPAEFNTSPATAAQVTCDHGARFPACVSCLPDAEQRVARHDRLGQPVQTAAAWH